MFFPSKIAQFRSEYQLKDHLKQPPPSESIPHITIDNSNPILSPHRSLSKVLSDQTFDTIDRTNTSTRRYSSSDIDQQSLHLYDSQQQQLIDQQKKRRIYNFNHTLFSNIYKRTHRSSSIDSMQTRERNTRRRNQSPRESEIVNEPTTSDSVYSRALEKNTTNTTSYRKTLSVPDENHASRPRLSSSGYTSDSATNEPSNRPKKLSFLPSRRRASYYQSGTANNLTDEQKRKQNVIWPLKRSYSFDTPFHRETIEALNKGKLFDLDLSNFRDETKLDLLQNRHILRMNLVSRLFVRQLAFCVISVICFAWIDVVSN